MLGAAQALRDNLRPVGRIPQIGRCAGAARADKEGAAPASSQPAQPLVTLQKNARRREPFSSPCVVSFVRRRPEPILAPHHITEIGSIPNSGQGGSRLTANKRVCVAVTLALAAAFVLPPVRAHAAGIGAGPSEVIFLFQLVLLILVGRLLGELFARLGQPAVTGQLIAGILLGPSLLGAIWPEAHHYIFPGSPEQKAMLSAVSQVGILL